MNWKLLDRARRSVSNPVQLDVLESYVAGSISRRNFLKRGSIVGLSLPFMGAVIAACGDGGSEGTTGTGGAGEGTQAPAGTEAPAGTTAGQEGGILRISTVTPASPLDPVLMQDLASYGVVFQSFEHLVSFDADGNLAPGLAESWESNDDGTVWTFNLAQGVKWQDGSDFSSADVAATFDRMVEVGNSALQGVIAAGSVDSSDPNVAVVTLEGPNGNLPALVSNYNAQSPITPVAYEPGTTLDASPNGTGPWKLVSYDPATKAVFERNPDWRGGSTPLDGVEFQFFDDIGTQITAVQGGSVDAIVQFQVIGADALFNNDNFVVKDIEAATHRQVWMRVDQGQFADKRVRQALALTFNRQQLIDTLWRGRAVIGNDHVIAPFLPFFDESLEQRERNPEQAKQLLADAGFPDGLTATLNCGELQEIPQLAQLIQAGAAEGGFNLEINVEGLDTFYGNQWCPSADGGGPTDPPCVNAAELGIVDYGHRPVPDVYLNAALSTGGVWNSSQFANSEFDGAFGEYQAAVGVDEQKAAAGKLQRILNDEVPVGLPYFYNYLYGHSNEFQNVFVSALGHPNLAQASRV